MTDFVVERQSVKSKSVAILIYFYFLTLFSCLEDIGHVT